MTTTDNDQQAPLELAPYVFFYGRCEEALAFYARVFNGTYELTRNSDGPIAAKLPPEMKDKVMHAAFTAAGMTFMASDGREAKSLDPNEGNITLSISASDRARGGRLFDALAEGGSIEMPFADGFWGGMFGSVNDRFGIQWYIVTR